MKIPERNIKSDAKSLASKRVNYVLEDFFRKAYMYNAFHYGYSKGRAGAKKF